MKENPLSHKYIKVGNKIDLMVKEGTKPHQIMEIGDIAGTIMQGKIIEVIDLQETSEGMVDRRVGKTMAMEGMITTIEIGIGQGKEPLKGVMHNNAYLTYICTYTHIITLITHIIHEDTT